MSDFPSCTRCGRILLHDVGICEPCKKAREEGYRAGVEAMRDACNLYFTSSEDEDSESRYTELAGRLLKEGE